MLAPSGAEERTPAGGERDPHQGLPDDVAALFRWAGMEALPYFDFTSQAGVAPEPEMVEGAGCAAPGGVKPAGQAEVSRSQETPCAIEAETAEASSEPVVLQEHGAGESTRRQPAAVAPHGADATEAMLPMRLPQRRSGHFWPSGLREQELSQAQGRSPRRFAWTGRELGVGAAAEAATLAAQAAEPAIEGRPRVAEAGVAVAQAQQAPSGEGPGRTGGGTKVEQGGGMPVPSWIAREASRQARSGTSSAETLQTSRERVASRWYALRGLLAGGGSQVQGAAEEPVHPGAPPLLVIHSVAGGVGKTSLAASLARALAAQGERVLLVDMTGDGLLPFFFGAREFRSEERRTFAPPPGTLDAAIQLVTFAPERPAEGLSSPLVADRLRQYSKGFTRVIVDLPAGRAEELEWLLEANGRVLVPLSPELRSVLSLRALRQRLATVPTAAAAAVYLLLQFDPTERLHLDMREVLQQELGEALLPGVVRRSPLVSEALAQGMTVIDYAPEQEVTQDLREIAAWVRTAMEPHEDGVGQARWIER